MLLLVLGKNQEYYNYCIVMQETHWLGKQHIYSLSDVIDIIGIFFLRNLYYVFGHNVIL